MIIDDADLVKVLKQLILENEDELVRDMVFQTKKKTINQLVTNNLTDDMSGLFVRITIPESEARLADGSDSLWIGEYSVSIDVVDYARMQQMDDEPYEIVTEQFRVFIGKLVELIKNQKGWLAGERGRYRRPVDRTRQRIKKRDDSDWYPDESGNLYATCFGKISFYFEGQC